MITFKKYPSLCSVNSCLQGVGMIYKSSITAEEVNELRRAASFRQIDEAQINAGLRGSALVVCACQNGRTLGMARLIWDGGMTALITDLLVLPEHQNCGIEAELISRILDFLRKQLRPGFGIQVDVRAWGNQESLYQELGFEVSTPERRGIPIQLCLTEQIERTDALFQQCGFEQHAEMGR